tara:strand:+ start:3458 stop:4195 length:738 start_codon:yes stop_codon:yes gene_type:complete
MTKAELIQDIQDEITFSGMLPYSLPEKELGRILDIAARYFYDNWRHAVSSRYLLLPLEIFKSKEFKAAGRIIQLPECVQSVIEVKEAKGGSIFATIDRDFSEQKFVGSEAFLTPFIGESLMYRTIMFSFLDLTKGMILDTIAYDHNRNDHTLGIVGRTPKTDVVAKILKKIDIDKLYEDELYQRYVRANAKVRLAHMLQTFNYQLPGDITLNYQNMVATAEKETEEVKAMMKGENTVDWMFLTRQ